jgi:hypothetical protein
MIIKIAALLALPFILGFTIVVLALALIGEVFAVPFGGIHLILGGAFGAAVPGNGLSARDYIKDNADNVLWGPLIVASRILLPVWDNFFDFLLGPGSEFQRTPLPRQANSYQVLPSGVRSTQRLSSRSAIDQSSRKTYSPVDDDMRDIEDILRKRGV